MTADFAPANRYEPRTVAALGIAHHAGWRIKRYSITCAGVPFDAARFGEPESLAFRALPAPAMAPSRPGLAFTIAHQGRGADYLVLAWWDRDNELPIRVWVSAPARDDARWTPARDAESVCVWDLAVLWHERQAYVRTMIGASPPDPDAYLRDLCPASV